MSSLPVTVRICTKETSLLTTPRTHEASDSRIEGHIMQYIVEYVADMYS
jgi:hypothetical protein